jgi:sn-glycerol 3-phosphate transport system ATP-binding protein
LKVETVEMLGAERLIHARLGDESLIIRTHEDQGAPAVGSTVFAKPREDRLHWFDSQTGQRL